MTEIFTYCALRVKISDMGIDLKALGSKIKAARGEKGVSQEDLAEQLGISRPSLSDYENGKTAPAVDILLSIASCLEKDFEVDGFVIERRVRPLEVIPHQLSLNFYEDGTAVIRIRPAEKGLMIGPVKIDGATGAA